jgi:hypothetical protein
MKTTYWIQVLWGTRYRISTKSPLVAEEQWIDCMETSFRKWKTDLKNNVRGYPDDKFRAIKRVEVKTKETILA